MRLNASGSISQTAVSSQFFRLLILTTCALPMLPMPIMPNFTFSMEKDSCFLRLRLNMSFLTIQPPPGKAKQSASFFRQKVICFPHIKIKRNLFYCGTEQFYRDQTYPLVLSQTILRKLHPHFHEHRITAPEERHIFRLMIRNGISELCNWNCQHCFTNAFRRTCGCPPGKMIADSGSQPSIQSPCRDSGYSPGQTPA